MGLLEMFGVGDNPFYQAFDQNRGKITNAFAGMVGAGNDPRQALTGWTQGLQHGVNVDTERAIIAKQEAEKQAAMQAETAKQNQTLEWLRQNAPEYADAVANGVMTAGDAWGATLKARQPGGGVEAPANIREWEAYSAMTPEQQAAYIRMKRANPYLDLGTGYAQPDPTNPGQISGPVIAKDNFTPAYDSAAGSASGKVDVENQSLYESMASKMPGLKAVVTELGDVGQKATYTQAGKLWDDIVRETGSMPSEGAIARTKYMAMVDNQVLPLLRDTFGAAFTVQEGESLRATLGAPDKSPIEKQAVLEAFIEQKVRDLEALESRLPPGSAQAASGVVSYKDYF